MLYIILNSSPEGVQNKCFVTLHYIFMLLRDVILYRFLKTQFPDVNDSELKSMESKVVAMAQKLKESSDVVRQLDSGLQLGFSWW